MSAVECYNNVQNLKRKRLLSNQNLWGRLYMFQEEKRIRKEIVTPDGEDEFQIRYIRNEDAGIVVTRSGKSYFILDSIEYWYDLIQNKYPTKQKCRCKNDYFRICFQYVTRIGTDDYKAVELISCCTECGKQRSNFDISEHILFDHHKDIMKLSADLYQIMAKCLGHNRTCSRT